MSCCPRSSSGKSVSFHAAAMRTASRLDGTSCTRTHQARLRLEGNYSRSYIRGLDAELAAHDQTGSQQVIYVSCRERLA
jgi:hypothetical protein